MLLKKIRIFSDGRKLKRVRLRSLTYGISPFIYIEENDLQEKINKK